jgi:peptidoglycan/LPS O-acetylase OafA/YrhL
LKAGFEIMKPTFGTRLAFIDALRGIAAVSVVLFHAREGDHIPALQRALPGFAVYVIEQGFLGVPVFFVLSGFVIALSLDGKDMTLGNAGRFFLRRSLRLDPPYWVAIALAVGFGVLANHVVQGREIEQFTVPQVLAHLVYAQDLLGYKDANTVFWTLCLEVQFYVVFALLVVFRRRVLAVAVAGFVSLLWPLGLVSIVHHGLFLQYWYAFLIGSITYYSISGKCPPAILFGILAIVCLAWILHHDEFAIAAAITSGLIFCVGARGRLHDLLDWRWLQGLGAISYSLYLIHNPLTGATFRIGALLRDHSVAWDVVWWLISIIVCILAATAMWAFVERPSMKLSRRIPLERNIGASLSENAAIGTASSA